MPLKLTNMKFELVNRLHIVNMTIKQKPESLFNTCIYKITYSYIYSTQSNAAYAELQCSKYISAP